MEDQLNEPGDKKQGLIYAFLSYIAWGLLPLYWKILQQVPADQVLAHRIFWSFIFVGGIVAFNGSWHKVKVLLSNRRQLGIVFLCAIIISCNWFTYIWAVQANQVVEASMGYYIGPLITVLLGVIVLKEKLSGWKWMAVLLAAVGVGYLTFQYGEIPWVAIILACSFALYGLIKKMLQVDSITGLFLETVSLAPLALGYILWQQSQGVGAIGAISIPVLLILICSGVATATPLLWFSLAAKRVNLSTLGFLQYLAPSISLYLGVAIFNEPFTTAHIISFSCIWVAIFIYTGDNIKTYRANRVPVNLNNPQVEQ